MTATLNNRLFPSGFGAYKRNRAQIRAFLVKRLKLDENVADVDAAAEKAFLALPQTEHDTFHAAWLEFLGGLE